MRAALFAAWLVTGCYSPGYRDCEITCVSGACPSGLSCEQGVCRVGGFDGPCSGTNEDARSDGVMIDAFVPDGPPGDVDSDSVLNADDNCPNKSNTNQANEDNDSFGDVCDPCPIGPTAADNADGDGDGVGEGCDPETGVQNQITLFEGFRDPIMPPGAMMAGNWSFINGQASSPEVAGFAAGLFWTQPANASDVISTHVTVIENQNATQGTGAGVGQRFDPNANMGVMCWRFAQGPLIPNLTLQEVNGTLSTSAPLNNADLTHRFVFTRDGQSYTCEERLQTVVLSGASNWMPANPVLGLLTFDMEARFDWIMVVSRN